MRFNGLPKIWVPEFKELERGVHRTFVRNLSALFLRSSPRHWAFMGRPGLRRHVRGLERSAQDVVLPQKIINPGKNWGSVRPQSNYTLTKLNHFTPKDYGPDVA